jgi:hypothetical protein
VDVDAVTDRWHALAGDESRLTLDSDGRALDAWTLRDPDNNWGPSLDRRNGCTCGECVAPAYGAPGLAHCAACCYGTGVAEYNPDCPIDTHRDWAAFQWGAGPDPRLQDLPVDHGDGLRTAPITAVSSVPDPRGAHPLRPGDRATP